MQEEQKVRMLGAYIGKKRRDIYSSSISDEEASASSRLVKVAG
jgi:hypothetical protein